MSGDKDFTYINNFYNKNFKSGMLARASGELCTLLYGDNYAWVKMQNGETRNYHPLDIKLLDVKEVKDEVKKSE